MRAVVFGAGGMLGRALVRAFDAAGHEPAGSEHHHGGIDSLGYVADVISTVQPDVVVNAAGAIPLRNRPITDVVRANALGPHVLALVCEAHGALLIHVSTDCVFSGALRQDQAYAAGVDTPDPHDAYGLSKALGEPSGQRVLTVRTSFAGAEHGLWAWLRGQPPGSTVEGWRNALWSGTTVDAVARSLVALAEAPPLVAGTFHLATEFPVRKSYVVDTLNERLRLGLIVRHTSDPIINRSLRHSPVLGPPLEPFDVALDRYLREGQES